MRKDCVNTCGCTALRDFWENSRQLFSKDGVNVTMV